MGVTEKTHQQGPTVSAAFWTRPENRKQTTRNSQLQRFRAAGSVHKSPDAAYGCLLRAPMDSDPRTSSIHSLASLRHQSSRVARLTLCLTPRSDPNAAMSPEGKPRQKRACGGVEKVNFGCCEQAFLDLFSRRWRASSARCVPPYNHAATFPKLS